MSSREGFGCSYDSLKDDVHLWTLSSTSLDEVQLDGYRKLLSPDEIERMERATTDELRLELLAARGALRELLGRYFTIDPAHIRFDYQSNGKPSVAFPAEPPIRFNLSHSHSKLVFAFSACTELGVDIERNAPEMITDDLISLVFTEREIEELSRLPRELFVRGFYTAWTRKEAFIKGTGEGVSANLQSFGVTVDPREAAVLTGDSHTLGWHITSLQLFPGYEAAIAVFGNDSHICMSENRRI